MKGLYIALGILLLIVLWGGCGYNGMNAASKDVDQKWAEVQSSYQRRLDLIPNLVETVKGAADFEKSTYVQVAMARSGKLNTMANVSAKDLTPEKLAAIQQANAEAQAATRLAINVVMEQYPQLRGTEAFTDLQKQLEGTENRINTSRNAFNESVRDYNIRVSNFPTNLLAGMFHFKERQSFQAEAGAEKSPKVKF
ncbi:MAG: LemA family protein [Flavipsychrobacter sp.]|jgi:LemA protein|nr:LemA family protein [Flavipsychrobacter sp.]